MTTITFEVDDELKARLEDLSGRLHLDAADVLRDALLEKLEELEDFETVRERLKTPHQRIDDSEVWRGELEVQSAVVVRSTAGND